MMFLAPHFHPLADLDAMSALCAHAHAHDADSSLAHALCHCGPPPPPPPPVPRYIIQPALVDEDDIALASEPFVMRQQPSVLPAPSPSPPAVVKPEPVEHALGAYDPFVYEQHPSSEAMFDFQPGLRGGTLGGGAWHAREVKRMRGMMGVFRVDPFTGGALPACAPQLDEFAGEDAVETSWQAQLGDDEEEDVTCPRSTARDPRPFNSGARTAESHAPFSSLLATMDAPLPRPSTASSSSSYAPSALTPSPATLEGAPAVPPKKKVKKVKMHACDACGKEFPRPSGLQTHMNVHSGAKPYKCPVPGCAKRFGVRSNATRHLRVHQRQQAHASAQAHAAAAARATNNFSVEWLHSLPDAGAGGSGTYAAGPGPGSAGSYSSTASTLMHSAAHPSLPSVLRPTPADALAAAQQAQHAPTDARWVPDSLAQMSNALALPLAARGPRVEAGSGSGSAGGSEWPYHPSQVRSVAAVPQQEGAETEWAAAQWQRLPGRGAWGWVGA